MADASKKHAFMSIQLKGNDDDTILNNYKKVDKDFFIKDVDVKLAGLQPLAAELTGTIGEDQQRAEVAAIPLVAVLLFFVFGGVVAASLPAIIGGLSILGALGIMRLIALVTPVHFFAQPVVTLIGLGIAIDYGLFIVSRFREEIAEGYDTEAAVRRTMMTSGRTVIFSAVIIVASSLPLLLFPQLPEIHHLRDHRLGHAVGGPVDHRAGRDPGHPRPERRRARCADAAAAAVPTQLGGFLARDHRLVRREDAEDQDPRRGRGRFLGGQARQPGDETPDPVRRPRSSSS